MKVTTASGRLTRAPKAQQGASHRVFATIACTVVGTNAVRGSEYVDLVLEGQLAELVLKHGAVGRTITVIGNEHSKTFRKRDGSPGFTNEIYVLELDLGADPSGGTP
jgi:hypothetical protein